MERISLHHHVIHVWHAYLAGSSANSDKYTGLGPPGLSATDCQQVCALNDHGLTLLLWKYVLLLGCVIRASKNQQDHIPVQNRHGGFRTGSCPPRKLYLALYILFKTAHEGVTSYTLKHGYQAGNLPAWSLAARMQAHGGTKIPPGVCSASGESTMMGC